MFQMPQFATHLLRQHGASHDPKRHVMLKINRFAMHIIHRRAFVPVAPLPLLEEPNSPTAASSASSSSSPPPQPIDPLLDLHFSDPPEPYAAECIRRQRETYHPG